MTPVVIDRAAALAMALPDEGGAMVTAVDAAMRHGTALKSAAQPASTNAAQPGVICSISTCTGLPGRQSAFRATNFSR